MPSLNIFDHVGHVRDIAPEEVPDDQDQREALFKCLAACRAAEEGEARRDAARKVVTERMREHDAALAADHEAHPPATHQENLLAAIAARKPGYKPKPAKIDSKIRDALDSAMVALAEARAELTRATAALKELDRARGEATIAWINVGPSVTQESLHREMVAAEQERKTAIAEGRMKAPPPKPVRAHQSELDKVLAGRGKAAKNRQPAYFGPR